jgi:Ca2+:H+ antiporter
MPQILRPIWTFIAPVLGWLLLAGSAAGLGGPFLALVGLGLVATVMAAVHHAEVIAHRVGEPFGSLVLALAITVIELALIVSLMLTGGETANALARDTVFATIMLILNGVTGLCILVGGAQHREQSFGLHGATAALGVLATMAVIILILPNYTISTPGPFYAAGQLGFVAIGCLALYGVFVLVQTVRHRDYFLPADQAAHDEAAHAPPPSTAAAWLSLVALMVALAAVVLLAKTLSPSVEAGLAAIGAPKAAIGVVIAAIVLMPESLAAVRAARNDRLQTSLNLALGSALATIGLTIPAVAALSLVFGWKLVLGLDDTSTTLLVLSLFVAALSLSTGRTTVLQGATHLMIFGIYLVTTLVP